MYNVQFCNNALLTREEAAYSMQTCAAQQMSAPLDGRSCLYLPSRSRTTDSTLLSEPLSKSNRPQRNTDSDVAENVGGGSCISTVCCVCHFLLREQGRPYTSHVF